MGKLSFHCNWRRARKIFTVFRKFSVFKTYELIECYVLKSHKRRIVYTQKMVSDPCRETGINLHSKFLTWPFPKSELAFREHGKSFWNLSDSEINWNFVKRILPALKALEIIQNYLIEILKSFDRKVYGDFSLLRIRCNKIY